MSRVGRRKEFIVPIMKKMSFAGASLLWGAVAAAVIAADRAVKHMILTSFTEGTVMGELPGFFDFIYVRNTGAAFSLFSDMTLLLGIVSVLFCICVAVYWFIRKPKSNVKRAAVALLFAGALGNAFDRLFYGFVVDFISLKWFDFPVFNIADSAIVIGALLVVVYVAFFDKADKKDEDDKNDGKERN